MKEALRVREVEVLPDGKKVRALLCLLSLLLWFLLGSFLPSLIFFSSSFVVAKLPLTHVFLPFSFLCILQRVYDENDGYVDVDRVVFACPSNAVGNILKKHGYFEEVILSTPVYADDHHPSTGHMHAVMHSDSSVIAPEYREEVVKRASNYVEVTRLGDPENGPINIENQYNFGVQTPGPGVSDTPPEKKPVMLISHALGEGKSIDDGLVRGEGNHARAHPLYSGWNVAAMLSLRLVQGKNGIYYCSNWTTPGNCHDMSILSGFICAHAIGADYPFPEDAEAKKDFHRLRDLMGF